MKLDHIGIAVEDLEKTCEIYRKLGLAQGESQDLPQHGVRVSFFPLGEGQVELVMPLRSDSAVAKFLAKRGPGFHHLCFQVDDLPGELARLAAAGFELIDREPRVGAHRALVAFLHPRSTGGVLIEPSQHPDS